MNSNSPVRFYSEPHRGIFCHFKFSAAGRLQFGGGTAAGLAAAVDDVRVGAQLGQPHGAAGVQLLGADAHLAAQAVKRWAAALSDVMMASLWWVECLAIWAMASSSVSTTATLSL